MLGWLIRRGEGIRTRASLDIRDCAALVIWSGGKRRRREAIKPIGGGKMDLLFRVLVFLVCVGLKVKEKTKWKR